ncbi:glycosyltransferase [Candidatus Pelagibacter sp.]|uniref:glycosyltransferase n=1 Tax=Candidatus Pelagibacter sp. TaxID=2024849 RepID=UPI003D0C1C08
MSKQILVLGMHRSGTSMVSRILNLMGCYYSSEDQTVLPGEDNPKGFWERKDVMDLNNKILNDYKSSWDNPYRLKNVEIDKSKYLNQLKNIIYKLEPHRPWFIKDPRLSLTYNCWENILENNLNILVLRNPLEVSISLNKRNNIKYTSGLALWDFYTDRLVKQINIKNTILCFYDNFIDNPYKETIKLFNSLKKKKIKNIYKPTKEEIENFVDKKLYRSKINFKEKLFDKEISKFYLDKYNQLKLFNSNFSIISQTFINLEQQQNTIQSLNQTLTTKDQEIHNLNSTLTQRTEETEQQQNTIQSLNQTLTTKDQEIHNLNSTLTQRTEETEQQQNTIQSLNQTLTTKDQEIHNLNSTLTQRTEETEQQQNTIQSLNQTLTTKDQEIDILKNLNHQNFTKYENIKKSNSFKITKPLRWLGRLLRGEFHLALHPFKRKIKNINYKKKIYDHYVSIIIVNYNGLNHLDSLFKSLYNQTYNKFEIIFVDNNSYDNSVNFVRKKYPNVTIIVNKKNLYFAEANNIGFEKSIGDLILLLNNDTILDSNFLERLINKYNQDKDIVSVTPKILFFKKFFKLSLHIGKNVDLNFKHLIDNLEYKKYFIKSYHSIKKDIIKTDKKELTLWLPEDENIYLKLKSANITDKKLINYIKINDKKFYNYEIKNNFEILVKKNFTIDKNNKYIINNAGSSNYRNPYDVGFGELDLNQYKNKEFSELVCGCAVLINRYTIGYNKLFITEFKNYYEDSELSNRLVKKGKVAYENNAVVYHKHSATSVENSFHWQYYVARNKILYDFFLFKEKNIESKLNDFLSNIKFQDLTNVKKKLLSEINTITKKGIKNLLQPNVIRVAIYNEYWNTLGGGEKRALDFLYELKLSNNCIDLISSTDFDIDKLKNYFGHNNLKLRKRILNIKNDNISNEYDVFINSTYLSNLISHAKKSYFLISFPQKNVTTDFLNSYTFIPNSKYTLKWTKTYWKKKFKSKISYPKFNLNNKIKKNHKKKIILSVGRWTPLGHSKKQLEMSYFFKQICATHKFNDWKLILCGSIDINNKIEINYYEKVKKFLENNNLNFELHKNLSRDKLLHYYQEASIYWHFTGFKENLDNKPEMAEHFGMSIVEAISFNCIPFVFNFGGQVEILKCLNIDNTFSSYEELKNKMMQKKSFRKISLNTKFKKNFFFKINEKK